MYNYTIETINNHTFSNLFPNCFPCRCYLPHQKARSQPRYQVKLKLNNSENNIIKKINVKCSICGKQDVFNISHLKITIDDIVKKDIKIL